MERDGRFEWEEIENGYFNSHAHVERDAVPSKILSQAKYFNSHAHVERDTDLTGFVKEMKKFQLTRSRGA